MLWWQDPNWWTAIGTLVLAGAAIVAGIVAANAYNTQQVLLNLERKREKERTEAARQEQAGHVAPGPVIVGDGDADYVVVLRNASDLPVYEVRIIWYGNGGILGHRAVPQQQYGLHRHRTTRSRCP